MPDITLLLPLAPFIVLALAILALVAKHKILGLLLVFLIIPTSGVAIARTQNAWVALVGMVFLVVGVLILLGYILYQFVTSGNQGAWIFIKLALFTLVVVAFVTDSRFSSDIVQKATIIINLTTDAIQTTMKQASENKPLDLSSIRQSTRQPFSGSPALAAPAPAAPVAKPVVEELPVRVCEGAVLTIVDLTNKRVPANIRTASSEKAALMFSLSVNTQVTRLGTDANQYWTYIQVPATGAEGWVWSRRLDQNPPC